MTETGGIPKVPVTWARAVTFIIAPRPVPGGSSMHRYQCLECAYIYDPAKGDPTQQIPPGTSFEELPPTWRCPECKVSIRKQGIFKRLDD